MSDRRAVEAMARETRDAFGRIDILVNDAGGVLGQVGRPLEDVTPEQWQALFDVNVTGAFYCTQAVAPRMKALRWGRVVNISSGAGLGISLTGIQAYAAAKAAQIGLTRQLAHELGPWGITVNNILPGSVATERLYAVIGAQAKANRRTEAEQEALRLKSVPAGRFGRPSGLGDLIAFLASERAGYITAQNIAADGGQIKSIAP